MTSGREVLLGLRIAGAAGYVDPERVAPEVDSVDRIVAILYKLAYRPSGPPASRMSAIVDEAVRAATEPRCDARSAGRSSR